MLTDLIVVDIYDTLLEKEDSYIHEDTLLHSTDNHHHIYPTILLEEYGLRPFRVSISQIIEEINRDHSDAWLDYDEYDWLEGMYEWTSWRLVEDSIYNLIAIINDTPYGKISSDYRRLKEMYGGKTNDVA